MLQIEQIIDVAIATDNSMKVKLYLLQDRTQAFLHRKQIPYHSAIEKCTIAGIILKYFNKATHTEALDKH